MLLGQGQAQVDRSAACSLADVKTWGHETSLLKLNLPANRAEIRAEETGGIPHQHSLKHGRCERPHEAAGHLPFSLQPLCPQEFADQIDAGEFS